MKLENMENLEDVKKDLINHINNIKIAFDLSDIGNVVGIAIGKHISKESGFELTDFIVGLEHGISLVDGTHF